jgi:hypothetical protein
LLALIRLDGVVDIERDHPRSEALLKPMWWQVQQRTSLPHPRCRATVAMAD